MAIPKYLKPIDEAKANKIIEKCLKNGTGYFEYHFFEGQSNESYEFIDETNPIKPKLIRKDFGTCETGPLSL
jgi:hypothetical protein